MGEIKVPTLTASKTALNFGERKIRLCFFFSWLQSSSDFSSESLVVFVASNLRWTRSFRVLKNDVLVKCCDFLRLGYLSYVHVRIYIYIFL